MLVVLSVLGFVGSASVARFIPRDAPPQPQLARQRRAGRTAWLALAVFGTNVMLHLVLDSTAGGIRWLWPASEAEFALAHPTARHQPWYLNFVLHWTFALELLITAAAAASLWMRHRGRDVG